MNIYSLTFRDLQYLVALSELKHFGKAAKSCFVSQPALSSQIKKIEGYFDTCIFERKNKSVFLTPEGVKIIEHVKYILNDAKKLEESFQQQKSILSSNLTIGLIHTLSPYYPLYFLKKLKTRYPKLSLNIVDGFTDSLINDLKDGKIDIVIASSVISDSSLTEFHIFQEPLYLCVNSEHEFAKKEFMSTTDLNVENMLLLKDGNCLKDEVIDLCPKNKRGHIRDDQVSNLEVLKQMLAFHNNYGIVPAMAADIPNLLQKMILVKKFKDQKKVYRQISMFIRKGSSRIDEYIAFLKLLESCNPF